MRAMTSFRCLLLGIVALSSACKSAGSPESATAANVDDARPVAPDKPWPSLSTPERKAHMSDHVVPVMEAHFKRHDPKRYASFSCDTCHGADMVERAFKMPNPSLLALHPTGSAEQHKMVEQYPEMVKLMFNHVLPDMQTLLGAEPFDAETKTGFSCYACHPAAEPALEASR